MTDFSTIMHHLELMTSNQEQHREALQKMDGILGKVDRQVIRLEERARANGDAIGRIFAQCENHRKESQQVHATFSTWQARHDGRENGEEKAEAREDRRSFRMATWMKVAISGVAILAAGFAGSLTKVTDIIARFFGQ